MFLRNPEKARYLGLVLLKTVGNIQSFLAFPDSFKPVLRPFLTVSSSHKNRKETVSSPQLSHALVVKLQLVGMLLS